MKKSSHTDDHEYSLPTTAVTLSYKSAASQFSVGRCTRMHLQSLSVHRSIRITQVIRHFDKTAGEYLLPKSHDTRQVRMYTRSACHKSQPSSLHNGKRTIVVIMGRQTAKIREISQPLALTRHMQVFGLHCSRRLVPAALLPPAS